MGTRRGLQREITYAVMPEQAAFHTPPTNKPSPLRRVPHHKNASSSGHNLRLRITGWTGQHTPQKNRSSAP
jgi:hypothetical protein